MLNFKFPKQSKIMYRLRKSFRLIQTTVFNLIFKIRATFRFNCCTSDISSPLSPFWNTWIIAFAFHRRLEGETAGTSPPPKLKICCWHLMLFTKSSKGFHFLLCITGLTALVLSTFQKIVEKVTFLLNCYQKFLNQLCFFGQTRKNKGFSLAALGFWFGGSRGNGSEGAPAVGWKFPKFSKFFVDFSLKINLKFRWNFNIFWIF